MRVRPTSAQSSSREHRTSHRSPATPPVLEAIVRKALAKEPAELYPTVDELRVALEVYGAT